MWVTLVPLKGIMDSGPDEGREITVPAGTPMEGCLQRDKVTVYVMTGPFWLRSWCLNGIYTQGVEFQEYVVSEPERAGFQKLAEDALGGKETTPEDFLAMTRLRPTN